MSQSRPTGSAMNVATSSGKQQRLKAHLVAAPISNPSISGGPQRVVDVRSVNTIASSPYSNENSPFPLGSSPRIPSATTGIQGTPRSRTSSTVSKTRAVVTTQSSVGEPGDCIQLTAYGKPSAPLPVRKHHTRSPPFALPPTMASSVSIRRTQPTTTQPEGLPAKSDYSSSSSRQPFNSFEHSDNVTVWASARTSDSSSQGTQRTTRTTAISNAATNSGSQSTREHTPSQATVIRAPSVLSNQTDSSKRLASLDRQLTYPVANQPPKGSNDFSSKMTLTELRSFAERQRQSLIRQVHQLQLKEERLAWLRSVRLQASGGPPSNMMPLPGSQLNNEQERSLHKLRSIRGQTEQARLNNEELANDISVLARSLSIKEAELDACHQRTEELKKSLAAIDSCYTCLSKGISTRTCRSADKTETGKSLLGLSSQLPFVSDKDKKRWNDGLLEADRLDRNIASALNHNSQSKRHPRAADSGNSETVPVRSAEMSNFVSKHSDDDRRIPSVSNADETPDRSSGLAPGITPRCANMPTTSSDFGSLLSRASSPPTNRRSSLRMLLHAAAASGDSRAITCFPRLKTPPRYASRAVINDTYMRKICLDSVEKYKKTASEIYRANVERMYAKQQQQQNSSSESDKFSADLSTAKDSLEPGEIRVPANVPDSRLSYQTVGRASPTDSTASSSSSSSSLELIGIEHIPDKPTPTVNHNLNPVEEEAKQNTGDLDSGLGGSDDTGPSEHVSCSPQTPPSHRVTVYVDDSPGTDASLSNISYADGGSSSLKSILRKSARKSELENDCVSAKTAAAGDPSSASELPTRSSSVRFHPLALLLDAALEGDLELVKEVASKVSDVSEPNDEGITALHNAICAGRTEIAEFLVRVAGADVNAGDTDGWTPLHCAASCGNLQLARLLVEHGASLHARTLSDQETPLEKCDQGDDEAECEEYLFFQQERLGSAASGTVYVLFPRGLEAAGPGSADANLQPDELAVFPNERLRVIDRQPAGEDEWMLAEKTDGTRGLIPRSHISCYPLVRIPPGSRPILSLPVKPQPLLFWDDEDETNPAVLPARPLDSVQPHKVIDIELPNSGVIESSEQCESSPSKNNSADEDRPDSKTAL